MPSGGKICMVGYCFAENERADTFLGCFGFVHLVFKLVLRRFYSRVTRTKPPVSTP